ncbi:MAG: hypothetical protein FJ286_01245 [Planctomycetes bacterium]|nr:hypothetical protein [Planctomycetota bacterium]
MGREAKLLLGLLATLMGVFVGVLSMKLLVPRPPAGAGPDIHADVAETDSRDLVEPPHLAVDPVSPSEPPPPAVLRAPDGVRVVQASAAGPARDPFVSRTAFAQPAVDELPTEAAGASPPPAFRTALPEPVAIPAPVPGSAYVAAAGDSWWSLAERVYGDGRMYRALFAWNRGLDPRVSLVPGTPIDLPTRDRLDAAWPALLPRP